MSSYHEKVVRSFFQEHKLPDCTFEYRFHDTRKWRIDIAFVKFKVGIEVQGGIWVGGAHARGRFIVRDYEKINTAQLCGWIILQIQPKELCTVSVVELIKTAIELQKKRSG